MGRSNYKGKLLATICFDKTYDIRFGIIVYLKSLENGQQVKNLTFPTAICFVKKF